MQESHDVADGFERASQIEELVFLHIHTFHTDALQRWTHVEKVLVGEVVFFLYDADELRGFFQASVDFVIRFGEGHIIDTFFAQGAEAFFFQQLADGVEPYFLLEILRVYHSCSLSIYCLWRKDTIYLMILL